MTLSRALLPLAALAAGCEFGTYGPAFDPDVCLEVETCDDDNDGFDIESGDCDDADPLVHPEGVELCDGIDNDCDAATDEDGALDAAVYYRDADGDGYGDLDASVAACALPGGYVESPADCDDGSADAFPGGTEVCDGLDNDCDGNLDEGTATDVQTFYEDNDGDGFGSPWDTATGCAAPEGHVDNSLDCDDDEPTVYVGALETCDGRNTNCDGEESDDGIVTWFAADGAATDLSATFAAGSPGSPAAWSAVDDGTLRLCPGTYYASISLFSGAVAVEGLGGAELTTLAGGAPGIQGMKAGQSVLVRGLTISGGSGSRGGGISAAEGSALTVEDCVISGNQAWEGGGICLEPLATLAMTGTLVEGNVAGHEGGGIFASGAAILLSDSVIRDNQAENSGGGALLEQGASLTSTSSDWDQNAPEDVWLHTAGVPYQGSGTFTCHDATGCK